jgi:peptide/nickel transport system ATP-binding protein
MYKTLHHIEPSEPPFAKVVSIAPAPDLISVEDLSVEFRTPRGTLRVVNQVSWSARPGEILAIVGESGSGKSVTALAIMGLLAKPAGRIASGRILFDGHELTAMPDSEKRALRGRDIAMIFQEPMSSLNPILTIGLQIMEPLILHLGMHRQQARARAIELLTLVGISEADRRLDQYPHNFSGGMRQRVMIAIGLACNPKLIIADEPTTALDVTIQAQILELMKDLSVRLGITLVIITHNLGIVARYAHRVVVMYAGSLVEEGSAAQIFSNPRHPYTKGLLRSVPRLDLPRGRKLETIEGQPPDLSRLGAGCSFAPRCPYRTPQCESAPSACSLPDGRRSACHRHEELDGMAAALPAADTIAAPRDAGAPLLSVQLLTKHFKVKPAGSGGSALVRAVENVSFSIEAGRTLGLVGESGCGKTTIGRMLLRLEEATQGSVLFDGEDILKASASRMKALRTQIQVIFQDPYSSLNPRIKVGDIIGEPLRVYKKTVGRSATGERVANLLQQVGLLPDMAERYPHQLSGGQRQRVGIARALAMEPRFIVCDEPVSALDVSIQGQIINLLDDLQRQQNLSYLFIAHDLAVVRHLAHRVVVMYLGHVMEVAEREDLYASPLHPYTLALMDAAPVPDHALERARAPRPLYGEMPSPLNPPQGCVFHTRCPRASAECKTEAPALREIRPRHFAACIKL